MPSPPHPSLGDTARRRLCPSHLESWGLGGEFAQAEKPGDREREVVVTGCTGQNLWAPGMKAWGPVRSIGPLKTQTRIRCLVR